MSEPKPTDQTGEVPTDAIDVVVQIADILREYLSTDSSFSPERAIERVRIQINSKAGMAAFVSDALRPGEAGAEVVIVKLAEALDHSGQTPENVVLELIDIVESPLAIQVYDREMERRNSVGVPTF